MDSRQVPPISLEKSLVWKMSPGTPNEGLSYLSSGIIHIQDLVERALSELISGKRLHDVGVYIQHFPFPCHISDPFFASVSRCIIMLMTMIWLYPFSSQILLVVEEKEILLRRVLRLAGVRRDAYWFSWFLSGTIWMSILACLLTSQLYFGGLLPRSNVAVLLLLNLVYVLTLNSFCMLLSACFTQTTSATACSGVFYVFTFIPFTYIFWHGDVGPVWTLVLCLCGSSAYPLAISNICKLEELGEGAQWSNLFESLFADNEFSLYHCMMMLLLDCVLYSLLSVYIDSRVEGSSGVSVVQDTLRRLWNLIRVCIPFRPSSAWHPLSRSDDDLQTVQVLSSSSHTLLQHHTDSERCAILLSNVSLAYGSLKVIDGTNLMVPRNQATALTGPNGAGKSSLLALACGFTRPCSGSCTILDAPTSSRWFRKRRPIAFCQQQDVFMRNLTVAEHFSFYCALYGRGYSSITRTMEMLGLQEKVNSLTSELSGGMQRRLSVALTALSTSPILVLDEPTAGVDLVSRRKILDWIRTEKKERTILFSSHSMDESEVVSDHVVVMSKGSIVASGDPQQLKEQHGTGYQLRVTCKQERPTDRSSLTRLTTELIPECRPSIASTPNQIVFDVPRSSLTEAGFVDLMTALESEEYSKLYSFELCNSSLKEVFKFATGSLDHLEQTCKVTRDRKLCLHDEDYNTGCWLWLVQVVALVIRRWRFFTRDPFTTTIQNVLPTFFLFCSLLTIFPGMSHQREEIEMSRVTAAGKNFVVLANPGWKKWNLAVREPSSCLLNTKCRGVPTIELPNNFSYIQQAKRSQRAVCSCSLQYQQCSPDAYGPMPPTYAADSGDMVHVLSHRNVSDYTVKTEFEYFMVRSGGFGYERLPESYHLPFSNEKWPVITDYVAKLWFANRGYHALPRYHNALTNSILKSVLPSGVNMEDYGINVVIQPVNVYGRRKEDTGASEQSTIFIACFILVAFAYIPSGVAVYIVHDRISNSKHLLTTFGLKRLTYWIGMLLWDLLALFIPICITLLLLYLFDHKLFISLENIQLTVSLFMFFGVSVIPMIYFVAMLFSKPTAAYVFLVSFNYFCGVFGTTWSFLLQFFQNNPNITLINWILRHILMLSPNYCLGRGILDIIGRQICEDLASEFGVKLEVKAESELWLSKMFFCMAVMSALMFTATVLLDSGFFSKKRSNNTKESCTTVSPRSSEEVLTVSSLSKVYSRPCSKASFCAVEDISFQVRQGQCFGLLGYNGAGKTTTFRILTGQEFASSGQASICGMRVGDELCYSQGLLGYCPQGESLEFYLTTYEQLESVCRIKGVVEQQISQVVGYFLREMGLAQYQDQRIQCLSAGNKRKVSAVAALIGNPAVLFMDEPTTGMDPVSREMLWDAVMRVKRLGISVVLTTHSLDECEALCNFCGIMDKGRFLCVGSPEELKARYGSGYVLSVVAPPEEWDYVSDYLTSQLRGALIVGHSSSQIELILPSGVIKLSKVLVILRRLLDAYPFMKFSIARSTLEQVLDCLPRKGL